MAILLDMVLSGKLILMFFFLSFLEIAHYIIFMMLKEKGIFTWSIQYKHIVGSHLRYIWYIVAFSNVERISLNIPA